MTWAIFYWLSFLVPLCMIILQILITRGISLIRKDNLSLRREIEVVRVDVNGNLAASQDKLDSALAEIVDLKTEISDLKSEIVILKSIIAAEPPEAKRE